MYSNYPELVHKHPTHLACYLCAGVVGVGSMCSNYPTLRANITGLASSARHQCVAFNLYREKSMDDAQKKEVWRGSTSTGHDGQLC